MLEASLPAVFLPYQQRFMRAIDEHGVLVVEKSRRTGFSWAVAAVAMLTSSAARGAGGMDTFYMGYDKDMSREFIDYVATWANQLGRAASAVQEDIWTDPAHPERQVTIYRVRFASGFEVVALPSVARAWRGKQGLAIIDEAAFFDDLDEVLTAALALRVWGAHVVVISTHNGDTNPFAVLVNDIRAGRKPRYHLQRLTFDEAIADGLFRRVAQKLGIAWTAEGEAEWRAGIVAEYGDRADQELHVIPLPSTGAFLPAALIEARSAPDIPVLRWHCPASFVHLPEAQRLAAAHAFLADEVWPLLDRLSPEEAHALGFDIARRGDASVIWPLAIEKSLRLRTPFVVEMRGVPFSEQQTVLWSIIERLPRKRAVALDATGLGMDLAERTAQKFGAVVLQVMLSEPWYREHMPALKASFEDGLVVVPRHDDVHTDLRSLKLVRGIARVPDRVRDADGAQRHGDAAIALALGHFATRQAPDVYGYQAAGRRGAGHNGGPPIDDDDLADRWQRRRLDA